LALPDSASTNSSSKHRHKQRKPAGFKSKPSPERSPAQTASFLALLLSQPVNSQQTDHKNKNKNNVSLKANPVIVKQAAD